MQPPCLLLARDDEVARRVTGQLHACADVQRLASPADVMRECSTHDPLLLIMQLEWRAALDACRDVRQRYPDTLIIALGIMRSDPMIEAADLDVYACESLEIDRPRLQDLVRHAFDHLALLEENRILRDSATPAVDRTPTAAAPHAPTADKPLGPLTQAFRHSHDVESMLRSVLDTAANSAGVSRAGIFAPTGASPGFSLRAGLRCRPGTDSITVSRDDDFVQWMQEHAHVAARMTLPHIDPPATRTMIKRWLDRLGAEVVLPLHGRNRLIGWLFVGHLASGIPFDHESLKHLIAIAHDVSVVLENGLLTEEAAIQKTLAETVLGSIPAGIVAIDASTRVQWFNDSAASMLGLSADEIIGQPPTQLGARLADMLIRAAHGDSAADPVKWNDPITKLPLSVMTRALTDGASSLGAVAILHDLSRERLMRERQERIDRATFWTELAAAISHEVRNPLVAISTFAQLLPERHGDPEFREQFSKLAVEEIGRLNAMIDQVSDFANPPELRFQDLPLGEILTLSVKRAKEQLSSGIPVRITVPSTLPDVRGDIMALTDCFQHIVANAIESMQDVSDPSILIVATAGEKENPGQVLVRIQDNGPGMPPAIADKAFSPFCTIKARGIGLGLPIAKRTITDHNGHIDIETGSTGTTVVVSLPVAVTHEATHYEAAYSGSR